MFQVQWVRDNAVFAAEGRIFSARDVLFVEYFAGLFSGGGFAGAIGNIKPAKP